MRSKAPSAARHDETVTRWGRSTPAQACPLWCRVKPEIAPTGSVAHEADKVEGPGVSSQASFHAPSSWFEAASSA